MGEEDHDDTKLVPNGRTVIPKFCCKRGCFKEIIYLIIPIRYL